MKILEAAVHAINIKKKQTNKQKQGAHIIQFSRKCEDIGCPTWQF